MDILSLIKYEQEALQGAVAGFEEALSQAHEQSRHACFKRLALHIEQFITLDKEFLYPEISDLYSQAPKATQYGYGQHDKILSLLAKSRELLHGKGQASSNEELSEVANELGREVRQHVFYQQENIIPRMRELIPTQDREDLAEVFTDIKEELSMRLGQQSLLGGGEERALP